MKIYDLSHTISADTPVFPGTESPILEHPFTIAKNSYAETRLTFFSHVGTHMDAPAHMVAGGKTLDDYEAEHFVGKALVLDFSVDLANEEGCITLDMLKPYAEQIKQVEFILLYTGWSRFWGKEAYFKGFPALSTEAAKWLAGFFLKGIGTDAISIDLMSTGTFPVHNILMKKEILIIENLTNLEELVGEVFTLSALPLKFEKSDGAPTRVLGIL